MQGAGEGMDTEEGTTTTTGNIPALAKLKTIFVTLNNPKPKV